MFHADLHVHSRFSRACSKNCDIPSLAWWARRKGITVVGTGDFTHPGWAEELRETLEPAEPGLFQLRPELASRLRRDSPPSCQQPVRFLLCTEISTIYRAGDRTRKVHHLLYAPTLDAAAMITAALSKVGNLASDGRPILGLDSRHLLDITLNAGPGCYLVPAHIWTPWFAVLGSKSGFDSVADCYGDLAEHVFAVETGLSSDPPMNWMCSSLDGYRLVSNSDAHSPPMLGREATTLDVELDYFAIEDALRTGAGLHGTINFFPEGGRYHLDGHRKCGVRLEPAESASYGGLCPECGKPLTIGVLNRVTELADRPAGYRPPGAPQSTSLVALPEVVGEILGTGAKSKKVTAEVDRLVGALGPELAILLDVPVDEREPGRRQPAGRGRLPAAGRHRAERPRLRRRIRGNPAAGAGRPHPGTRTLRDARASAAVRGPGGCPRHASPGQHGRTAGHPGRRSRGPAALSMRGLPTRGRPGRCWLGWIRSSARRPEAAAPLMIIAGPGTGKTRTLTHRIAAAIASQQVRPEQCLALTFTRRAAEEMRERLAALLGLRAARLTVTTFHGLGLMLLREQHELAGLAADFSVADEQAVLEVATELAGIAAGRPGLAGRGGRRRGAARAAAPGAGRARAWWTSTAWSS